MIESEVAGVGSGAGEVPLVGDSGDERGAVVVVRLTVFGGLPPREGSGSTAEGDVSADVAGLDEVGDVGGA